MRRIVNPEVEPLTVEEVKEHLRIDGNEEDALLNGMITAARQLAEEETGRAFITQTWEATFWEQSNRIRLPRPEIQTVESVTNHEGKPLNYRLKGRVLVLAYPAREVTVRWVAGYGPNPADVPYTIRSAILGTVGHFYENREGQGELPEGAKQLLSLEAAPYL